MFDFTLVFCILAPASANDKLTGICSVRGNSLAIVPARSHELVMVTRDCKSSDQKYPQVVPCILYKSNSISNHSVESREAYEMKVII